MATILITHGVPTAGLECLQGHDIIMPAPLTAYSMEELMQLIPQADAVIAAGKLPGDVIRAGKKLRSSPTTERVMTAWILRRRLPAACR